MRQATIEGAGAALEGLRLDDSQLAVLALPDGVSASVAGAPGSGKTTTLVEAVAERVQQRGYRPEEVLVLAASRAAATRLRDRLALRLGVPTSGPLARTPSSFAFRLVSHAAAAVGAPAPSLLTGADEDALLREILAGHEEDGSGPVWPEHLTPQVRAVRTFRTELRELLMRAVELGVGPGRLRELGVQHERPEWVAAADFFDEYRAVLAQVRSSQLDPAELLAFATASLDRGEVDDVVGGLRLVLVDDLQESTAAALGLIGALARRGVPVLGFGDPDTASNSFRGGAAEAVGSLGMLLGVPDLRRLELRQVHRSGPLLRTAVAAVTGRIGAAAAGTQRRAAAARPDLPSELAVLEAPTPYRQWSALARELREQHLLHGVPWERMAVIVRSGSLVPAALKAFALADIPTVSAVGGRPVRDDPAARCLLAVVEVAVGRRELTAETAVDLLTSPVGRLDRLGVRTLRLALRAEELAGGGARGGDELLVDALAEPGRLVTIDHRVGRAADGLARLLAAVRDAHAAGGSAEELLWLVWERSGLARRWADDARSAGVTAAEANRSLDGVLALFTAARRFVERRPGDDARIFLDSLLDAEVPEDTLAPRSGGDAVLVATPAGVVGAEFDVVAVAGVQDGVWPNTRLRGSLLGAQDLARAVGGIGPEIDERRQVIDDELRMFALAVSRARRRVVVSAVVNDDETRSPFFSLLPDGPESLDASSPALSVRALTGRLRRELVDGRSDDERRRSAAAGLAQLAGDGVPGADPAQWHGLLDASTAEPLVDLADPEARVPVSPSKLEKFEENPLAWFLDTVAGEPPSSAMALGTLLHHVLETAAGPDQEELWRALEGRWGELVFEAPWLEEQQRRTARRMVEALSEYLADFERSGGRLVSAEGSFELPVGRALLRGTIDRVEQAADGSVLIVDLKTGSYSLTAEQLSSHGQLSAYQLAYASGLLEGLGEDHRPGGARLLFVKKGLRGRKYQGRDQPPFGEEEHGAFRGRVEAAAAGMAQAGFEGLLEIDEYAPGGAKVRWHIVKAVCSD